METTQRQYKESMIRYVLAKCSSLNTGPSDMPCSKDSDAVRALIGGATMEEAQEVASRWHSTYGLNGPKVGTHAQFSELFKAIL